MIGYLLIFAAGACLLLWLILGARRPRGSVLPPGEIVYSGIVPKERRILHAPKYHLTGAPDYVIKQGVKYVPVEVKSGRVPKKLYDSDRMQVISAALLVESEFGARPEKGYVQYPGKTFVVKVQEKSIARLLDAVRTMREARQTGTAPDAPPHRGSTARPARELRVPAGSRRRGREHVFEEQERETTVLRAFLWARALELCSVSGRLTYGAQLQATRLTAGG